MIKYADQQYKIYHQSNGEFQLKLTKYTEFFYLIVILQKLEYFWNLYNAISKEYSMINKKFFNNNYNDKIQFADNDVILNWLAFQKQENEEKINSSNTQIENKYYKISIDCINLCNYLIEDHQDLQKVYEEISKKIGMLEKNIEIQGWD